MKCDVTCTTLPWASAVELLKHITFNPFSCHKDQEGNIHSDLVFLPLPDKLKPGILDIFDQGPARAACDFAFAKNSYANN